MKQFIFTFLLLAQSLLFAQNTKIIGKMVDEQNQPLAGAIIMLSSTTDGALTDIEGNFSLEIKDSTAVYQLNFQYIGYAPLMQKVTVSAAGKTINIGTVQLSPELLKLEEEIVMAKSVSKNNLTLANKIEPGKKMKIDVKMPSASPTTQPTPHPTPPPAPSKTYYKSAVKPAPKTVSKPTQGQEMEKMVQMDVSIQLKNQEVQKKKEVEKLRKEMDKTLAEEEPKKKAEKAKKDGEKSKLETERARKDIAEKKLKAKEQAPEDPQSNEDYSLIVENQFKSPKDEPLSTFSADVDRASYSNIRRFIENGQKVERDAVRIEEMINYFPYNYPQPKDEHPLFINAEYSACPWNHQNTLLRVALKAKEIEAIQAPPSNLVFLIDVSGSMSDANKLPLLKEAFTLLINNLRQDDKVAIVVYAGAAGAILPSTSGGDKTTILAALNNLNAGGSTAGGAGIELAYKIAMENKFENGNNRVILATDGDFNVGVSSHSDLTRLIEEKRQSGIFLTCLGFGMGNYKDGTMEILADKGNGNYSYIDDIKEAKKLFGEELTGTLITVAKDVKIQVEFNPKLVASYRLVGYENRMLNTEDFKDDKKDAGEVGAGHCVTALYEIVPVNKNALAAETPLRYQTKVETAEANKNEIATVKVRYKLPKEDKSTEMQKIIPYQNIRWTDGSESYKNASEDFRFAASVAMWGLVLRSSPFVKDGDAKTVLKWAEISKGADKGGYRADYIELVKKNK